MITAALKSECDIAEYLRPCFRNGAAPEALILFSSVRVAVRSVPRLLSSPVRQDFMPCLLDSRVEPAGMWPPGAWACCTRRLSGGTAGGSVA